MSELSSLAQDLMNDIDIKPLHPKHKLLLYSRYVLSKLFCHFTIANISKTWISSSCHTNIQYDVYKSTKEVLKDFHSNQEDKLQHHLTSQGFFFSNVIKYSLSSVNSAWSEAQSHLPKNIYNFTIRYGTLTTPSLHIKTRTI